MPDMGDLVFDGTARSYDADGHLRISKSHISKACVNPYYGREIPGGDKLGLDPDKIYLMFRDPVELARAASTFAGKPILSRHVPISSEAHRPELVVGAIGSDVEFNFPYLDADLTFWEANAIAGIETDTVRELSCSYRYVPVMEPGDFEGQPYDGRMTNIEANHLAQVEAGRAGSDVLAADEAITTMKMTKLGNALVTTLGAMSPKLAQDSALPALVGKASKKTLNVAEVSTKLIAMDAALDPKVLSALFDAVLAKDSEKEEKEEKAEDMSTNGGMGGNGGSDSKDDDEDDEDEAPAQDCAECKAKDGKHAKDCKMSKDKKAKDKKAMDSAIASIRAELRESDEARRSVRDVVGDVIAQDSAEEIYAFALDSMSVDRKGVQGVAALRALFNLANSHRATAVPVVAMDAKGAVEQFPGLSRIRLV